MNGFNQRREIDYGGSVQQTGRLCCLNLDVFVAVNVLTWAKFGENWTSHTKLHANIWNHCRWDIVKIMLQMIICVMECEIVTSALASTYGHMHISKISFLRVATQSGLICQCICCAQSEPKTTCPRSCPVFCDSSLPSAGAVEQVRGIYLWQWQVYVSFAIRRIVQIYVSLFPSAFSKWLLVRH